MVMWTVQPRAADLSRDFTPAVGWESLELVERFNVPDTWTLTGPWSVLSWCTPGMGCIVDADGVQRASGRMWQRYRWTDQRTGILQCRASFVADNVSGRIIYPDGTHTVTGTPATFPVAYDTRTGTIEDLILGYIRSNLGNLALTDRRLADLVLPTSLGRGGTATVNARFDSLGTLVQDLAEAGRLRVKLEHDEDATLTPRLALRIDEVPDVSADVRFGTPGTGALGVLTGYSDTLTAPEVTHAIVAGGGEGQARQVLRVVDQAAADLWGVHAEQLVDQRQTVDPAEMTRAGVQALQAGAEPAVVEFTVTDGPDVQLYRDYGPGYLVGVDGPDGPLDNIVREVTTTVTAAGQTVRVVVGTPGASARTTTTDRQVDGALRRIEVLERST